MMSAPVLSRENEASAEPQRQNNLRDLEEVVPSVDIDDQVVRVSRRQGPPPSNMSSRSLDNFSSRSSPIKRSTRGQRQAPVSTENHGTDRRNMLDSQYLSENELPPVPKPAIDAQPQMLVQAQTFNG